MSSDSDSDSDDSSNQIPTDEEFQANLLRIRDNDPRLIRVNVDGDFISVQNMSDEGWEVLGRDIANNTHVEDLCIRDGALNDHQMSCFFRGLTSSSSISRLFMLFNASSAAGVRCVVPFLQNANNLQVLVLTDINLQSEGFNFIFRVLRNSPIEELSCCKNGIEALEIDIEHSPKHLERLVLEDNNINASGCQELAKLLRMGGATLTELDLKENEIDDEGVETLVSALRNNTSLRESYLGGNNEISSHGGILLLKLVNDISSIEATLRSNHTLEDLKFKFLDEEEEGQQIQQHIDVATHINRPDPSAGKNKLIETQLNSKRRAELAELQGITHSVFSEIDPLHLPEVLALVGNHHGHGELYVALRSSIAGVISTVNEEQLLKQQIAEYRTKLVRAEAKLAAIEAAKVHDELGPGSDESRSNKRRRS